MRAESLLLFNFFVAAHTRDPLELISTSFGSNIALTAHSQRREKVLYIKFHTACPSEVCSTRKFMQIHALLSSASWKRRNLHFYDSLFIGIWSIRGVLGKRFAIVINDGSLSEVRENDFIEE